MKILIIGETLDMRSGWGRYAHEVTAELGRRGVLHSFVSSSDLLPLSTKNFFLNVLRIRKKITKDISAVHSFDAWPFGVYAMLANLGKGRPTFITGVGTYSIPPRSGVKAILMRLAYTKAKEVFCISRYTLEKIRERAPSASLSVVHMGTTELPFITKENKENLLSLFNIHDSQKPIILTVGQIKHRKGQLDTLKAVNILKDKYPNILYIVVGSTIDAQYVQKIRDFARSNGLEDNLLIVGDKKTDHELPFFYSICDVFALNSNNDGDHFEGFGLVFLEAAQFGKPVVGSSGCGIEDALKNGYNGYLTEQGHIKDIQEKIALSLKNSASLGSNSLDFVKKFSWAKTVDEYLKNYTYFDDL